jgi:hypothetical protein
MRLIRNKKRLKDLMEDPRYVSYGWEGHERKRDFVVTRSDEIRGNFISMYIHLRCGPAVAVMNTIRSRFEFIWIFYNVTSK